MEELLNILSVCHMRNSKFDNFLVDLLIKVGTFKTKYEDVNNQLSFQYETHWAKGKKNIGWKQWK